MLINLDHINFLIRAIVLVLLMLVGYYLIQIGNRYLPERKRIVVHRHRLLFALVVIAAAFLVYYAFTKQPILGNMVGVLIAAAIFAFILSPLVDRFEKRGLKRSYAILVTYLIIFAVLFLIGFSVAPKAVEEIKNFFVYLPRNVSSLIEQSEAWTQKVMKSNPMLQEYFSKIGDVVREQIYKLQASVIKFGTNITGFASSAVTKILNMVLVPVVAFYFLRDDRKIKKHVLDMIPHSRRDGFLAISHDINSSLGSFVRGRLLMAVFVGAATAVMLLVFGIQYALVIGVITCVADVIPYIGPMLGFIPAVIIGYIQSPIKALWIGLGFMVIQWIENNVIGPKVLSKSTGLHPLTVLLGLIIGGGVAGVLGMIFAVPLLAVLKILWGYFYPHLKRYLPWQKTGGAR